MKQTRSSFFRTLFIMTGILLMFSACRKKDDHPDDATSKTETRKIKYTLQGNYTGKLSIVYYNDAGVAVTETSVALPWEKTFTAGSNVQYVGFSASTTSTSTVGVAGQTMTAKVLVNEVEKKATTVAADSNGHISFSPLLHYF